jgi:membrane-bound lytic murein transglycosylase D
MKTSHFYISYLLGIVFLAGCVSSGSVYEQGLYQSPSDLQHNKKTTTLATNAGEDSIFQHNDKDQPVKTPADSSLPERESLYEAKKSEVFVSEKTEVLEEVPEVDNGQKAQELLDTALEHYESSQIFWTQGDLEKSMENLDQAYALILKIDPEDNPGMVQDVDDLRYTISKRILEIYASRYVAVNGSHNEIPLVMNEHVEKEIRYFQNAKKKFFIESYKRSGRYRDEIVRKLKEAGLPEELSWLPLIESGFKVRALSRARALGLWQFIPSTGHKFGLKRDAWIDERLDPEKATDAAIAYLKELHSIFGDWTTVLAAYNCGEGRVLKVIRNQKVNYLDNFWDLYQRLPYETARYVPKFMATLHILNEPGKYGFYLGEPDEPVLSENVSLKKQVRLKDIAAKTNITLESLKSLNPELRHQTTPPSEYYLKVPHGTGIELLASLDAIPAWKPPQRSYVYHRVRRGETLSLIARKYGTSVTSIANANGIRRKHFIRVGQRLKIPVRGTRYSKIASAPKLSANGTYRVRKGDSLWLIAQKFNTSPARLKRLNGLRSTRLDVGQVIKVKQ